METKKILTISLEKARKLYKNDNEDMKSLLLETFSKEELEQQELSKTWEEYCENHYRKGYYLSEGGTVRAFTKCSYNAKLNFDSDKNTFESKENAEAILALCQLIRLRDEYNRHKPIDYDKEDNTPYAIVYDEATHSYTIVLSNKYARYKNLFVFHTQELAKEFLVNFEYLLDIFYKIMY